jgi:anti-sigma B factor antagonist
MTGALSRSANKQSGVTPRLTTKVDNRDAAAHVVLVGELDLATVGVAEEAMKRVDGDAGTLVLDLRGLNFLDSSGLRMILSAADSSDRGPRVFVVRGPAQVDRVFELTGAGERLNLVDDPSLIDQD